MRYIMALRRILVTQPKLTIRGSDSLPILESGDNILLEESPNTEQIRQNTNNPLGTLRNFLNGRSKNFTTYD